MTNMVSSLPASSNPPPMHRFGGVLSSMSELPLHKAGDVYAVEGTGTVRTLPAWPKGPPIDLYMTGRPTFVHSARWLIMPGGASYTFSPGDSCRLLPIGDGTWLVMWISRADGVPFIPGGMSLFPEPQGRLSLTSGVAETSADVTSATTLYYGQAKGDVLAVFEPSTGRWVLRKFTEPSLSLSGATANQAFDVFAYDTGSTIGLETLAWTNDTTRATAITKQDGIDVKSGDPSRRLIGSFQTIGTTGQTEDSHSKRFLSNRYNEVPRFMYATDPAGSWTYSTASYRQANNNAANQFEYMVCVSRPIWAHVQSLVVNNTGVNNVNVGIGIDSTSGNSAQLVQIANLSGTIYVPTTATYNGYPGIGRHKVTWLEFGGGSNTQTWLATSANNIAGIIGTVSN
ncbi:hypothetical protein ACQR16_06000 [Bradyrhizobium oligotrophicum]|uniref:hypothetical protein n=1 Tax=Bradyrhizobium oligotrophicum TaxID=44255 RepID=UPI003EB74393